MSKRRPPVVSGVRVVAAPAEIDTTTSGQLRVVLLDAGKGGHATIVVDMTGTRFCDSSGLSVLLRAHRRVLAEGGELRLALPAGGPVSRVFTLTGLDRVIPSFPSLDQALAAQLTAVILPWRPRPVPRRARGRGPGTRARR